MGEDKEKVVGAETEEAQETIQEEVTAETESKEKKEKPKKKKKPSSEELLLEIQDELAELKDKYFRNLAEVENSKKRLNEEIKKERKYGGYALANRLIDSLEIFNQAINMKTEDPTLKNFLYGFKMIDEMIFNALKDEGVSIIDTQVGEVFDPVKDEAFDKEYDPEKPENTVLRVQKKGYMFKDRILRPSLVVINIKPEEPETEKETENESKEG